MLDTKAFQFWRLPVLYLCLVLAFNGKASDAAHEEFGCKYVDNEYRMTHEEYLGFKVPIWSKEGMKSMLFPAVQNILPLHEKHEVQQTEKLDPPILIPDPDGNLITMNDVSSFRKFVEDYKQYKHSPGSKKTFESFYQNYDPLFQKEENCSDPACHFIHAFYKLKEKRLSRGQSIPPVYLVSAYVDPMIERKYNIHELNVSAIHYLPNEHIASALHILKRKHVQDHLAGIIKIEDPSSNRTGYVLMEPGYTNGEKVTHPFVAVVMEDGRPPSPELRGGVGFYQDMEFSMGKDTSNPFILAKYKNPRTVRHVLYYVDKPYCSFMENTIKPYLLRPNHGILEHDGRGELYGYLTFQYHQNNKGDIIGIHLQVRHGPFNAATHVYLPFKKSNTTLDYGEIKEHVADAFGRFNVDELYRYLIEDLKFIFKELGDEHFQKDFISLSNDQLDPFIPY